MSDIFCFCNCINIIIIVRTGFESLAHKMDGLMPKKLKTINL